jgi:Xaa-Pro aminopeptidase
VNARVERLRAELEMLGARTFLVTAPVNVSWLTGFDSSNAAVLVRFDGVKLVTDGRYISAARALEGVQALEGERDVASWLGDRLAELAEPPVAFEATTITWAAHAALSRNGTELVPARRVVENLRAVKEKGELEAVRRAARILDDMYERLAGEAFVGRTERDLAWWIERTLREHGADAIAFDPIVAGGPHAALPHHHPGAREIGSNETVVVDAGAKAGGFCSDCTRTFATGELSDDLRRAYAVCAAAQAAALAEVRPGVDARSLDALARRQIEEAGYEVLHGLGHGVGREVHELPVLRPEAEDVLAAGNVVTVEPGVYLPGRGGVRIEDLVIVTEEGAEVLTPFTKELLTVA